MDSTHPLKFFNSGRAIRSVFSRLPALLADMQKRYGDRFQAVREYYEYRRDSVGVVDLEQIVPVFGNVQSRE